MFQYLEQKQRFAYAETYYIIYADEYGKQGRFEEATAAYHKVLETQLKTQRGIVCMTLKKGFTMIALTVIAADRNTTSQNV
ncbi:hypothetical protein [Bacillus safensis]|uniref:Uncharacterized protein n=1 Tax=Bacillus safensis TaxID=561879 RepID=A0AC61YR33_BACIA|nr:hypothetical protein P5627_17635 [Bacillus safensis]